MGVLERIRRMGEGPGNADGKGAERKAPPRSVVAAAMPVNGPGVERVARGRAPATTEQWQQRAWYFYDVIGELRGPLIWIANAVSQADIHATELDQDTGKPTGPTEDAQAVAAAAQVLGGPAQRANLLKMIALCWQVVGECWIIIRPDTRTGKPDRWLVLSGNRVKAQGSGADAKWQYTDPFTGETIVLGPGDRMLRAWCPHPDDQAKADSAVRPALPVCMEVEKASQNIASRLDSRLAGNGVWLVPEEVDFPKGDHETTGAALMDLFLTVAETGLKNPGQAAAQVPIVLTAPGELLGQAVFQDFATQFDASVVELRQDALTRLAATLDMPKDVAEGTQGESNHWSAWQVEESTYKIFIEPLLKAIGDAVTEHWFRPALVAMGKTRDQAERFELDWDTTAIVARPDDTENLRDLHDRVLISDDYMLDQNGVPEDAKPDDTERTRRVLEKIVMGAPTLLADPNVAQALGLDIEVSPAAAGVEGTVENGELEPPEPTPTPPALAPGTQAPQDGPGALPATQRQEPEPQPVPDGLVAAAELIVYDALSRAGGRLLTNQNRGQFKTTPRHELYREIPYEHTASATVHSLMEGSFQFADRAAEALGVDPARFQAAMSAYVYGVLRSRARYERRELTWALRELM